MTSCISWVSRLTLLDLVEQIGLMKALSEGKSFVCRRL